MKISLTAFLCLVFSFAARCQYSGRAFDSLLISHFNADGPGAVVLLARDNQVIYQKAFGKADLELDVDMTTENVFRLGSVTKQFTACAILKLEEEGRLSLQDKISRFIPGYPQPAASITIEQLLTHTSGVKNYTGLNRFTEAVKRSDLSSKELVNFFKDEPLDFEPGTVFRYSNSGYVLLGYIIEKVTGKSYATYISETFFKPLGMAHSYYDNASMLMPHRASGYKPVNSGYANADFLSMTLPYAAGSLAASAGDLFTWYKALADGRVISAENMRRAFTSCQLPNGQLTGYGYGWMTGNVQGSPSVKHSGIVNGFVSYVAYLPEEKLFAAILANHENAPDPDMLASKILAILLGKPYDFREIKVDLAPYQSVYLLHNSEKKIMACEDGNLMYYGPGGLKARLVPTGKDRFVIGSSLSSIVFQRDAGGHVSGFILTGTDLPVKGTATGEKVATLTKVTLPQKLLRRYTGKYKFNPGPVFEVKLESGKLYGQVGNDKKELVAFGEHKFFARELDAVIVFNLDEGGDVKGLIKLQNGKMEAGKMSEE